MDIATLGLRVDADGYIRAMDRAEAASRRTTKAGEATERMARQLQQAFVALGLGLGVRELIAYADTWNLIEGRLSLVSSSTRNLGTIQNEVFAGAQRARVGFEATASLYTKLARNSESLGASQRDMLEVTEAVNKAFIVSGASASEVDSSVRQLGQAFASGTLRGDELNTMLENAPRLAQAVAAGMGVTVGELRKLGKEGKLTSAEVFNAIHSQAAVIEEEFARMPVTVGQSMTMLKNEVMRFVGLGDNATGMSKRLADTIILVSENLGTLLRVLAAAGAAYVVYTNHAKLAAFWTAAVATAQTIAAWVSLAAQIRTGAAAMAYFSMMGKGVLAFLTGPAGIAIALGIAVLALIGYRTEAQRAARANDEFAASLAGMSKMQVNVSTADLERRQFEASREMERLRAEGRQFETVRDRRAPAGVDLYITRETAAYREQREALAQVNIQLAAVEQHREAMAELDVRPTATGGGTAATTQQEDMLRLAQQAAALAQLEGDAQARLAIEYDATNKAIAARRELAGGMLAQALAAIDAERAANLAALTREARRTNEDAAREAEQAARVAELEGAAQEALAVNYAAVNREIEARRNLSGPLLNETLAVIARERELAMAALSSAAAMDERRQSVERVSTAERELALAQAAGQASMVTGLDGALRIERSHAAERLRIHQEADAAILAARTRLGTALAALLPGVVASIEAQRRLRLETVAVTEAAEKEAERLQQVASVLEDFRGRVAGTFTDLFEGVFTRGLDGFRQFFASVHQMLARMVAEMLSRAVMARIGNSIAGSLAGVFGNMPGAVSAPSPTAITMQSAGATMMSAAVTMQGAAATMAGAALPVPGMTEAAPMKLEAISITAQESWAATMVRYLGPALAGYALGRAVGGTTENRALGTLGGAASGAAAGFMMGGPVGAVIGATLGAIGGFIGSTKRREEAEKRLAELLEGNNARLEDLRRSMDAMAGSALRMQEAGRMVARIVTAIGPGGLSGGGIDALSEMDIGKALRGESTSDAVAARLRELESMFGISFRELAAIARETGIELFDSAGRLVPAALTQLTQALGYTVERLTRYGNSIEEQTAQQQAYNRLFDVADTPVQQLNDALSLLTKNAPGLAEMFGLNGLDTASQAGRDALLAGLQDIFTLITSGALTPELLGAFGDKDGLVRALLAAKDGLDAFRQSVESVTTDFPRAMDVLLYEQRYGTGTTGPTSATRAQAPTSAPASATGATAAGVMQVREMRIEIHATQGESGESLLRRMEDAARERAARGGYVYIPGAATSEA